VPLSDDFPAMPATGMDLWLDSTQLTGADASAVVSMADRSGNARRFITPGYGTSPKLHVPSSQFQEMVAVKTTSLGAPLQSLYRNDALFRSAADQSWLFVFYFPDGVANCGFLSLRDNAGGGGFQVWYDGANRAFTISNGITTNTYSIVGSGNAQILQWDYTAATGRFRLYREAVLLQNVVTPFGNVPANVGLSIGTRTATDTAATNYGGTEFGYLCRWSRVLTAIERRSAYVYSKLAFQP
jgi:hypothetical protein